MLDLAKAKHTDFEPALNQMFHANVDGHEIKLELVECSKLKHGPHDGNPETRHPFRLLFSAKDQPQLNQGSIRMTHPTVGEILVFIVPVAVGTYESILS